MSVRQLLCKSSRRAVNILFMLYPQYLKLLNPQSLMFNISSINIGWMNRYLWYFISVYSGHGAAPFRFPPGYIVVGWQPSAAAQATPRQRLPAQGRQGRCQSWSFPPNGASSNSQSFHWGFPSARPRPSQHWTTVWDFFYPNLFLASLLSQVSDLHCDLSSVVCFCSFLLFIPYKELPL